MGEEQITKARAIALGLASVKIGRDTKRHVKLRVPARPEGMLDRQPVIREDAATAMCAVCQ